MVKSIIYSILLTILFQQKGFPQVKNSYKDSLFQVINSGKEDTVKVNNYLLFGEFFENTNPDSAAFYYEKSRTLSEKLHYNKGLATYISYYIVLLNNSGKYDEALKLNLEAVQIFKDLHSERDVAVAYNNLGNSYEHLGNLPDAVESYITAYNIILNTEQKSHKDSVLLSVFTNNIGSVFAELNQYEKGYAYVTRANEIANLLRDDQRIASSLVNLANYESMMGTSEQALVRSKKVESLSRKLNDYTYFLDAKLTEGNIYNTQKKFDKAITEFQTVIDTAKSHEDPGYELNGWQGISKSWLGKKNLEKSSEATDKAMDIAISIGDKPALKDLYLLNAEIKEKSNDLAAALIYRKKYELLNDTLLGEQTQRDITMLDIKFQTRQKELEIQSKNTLIQKNKEIIHKKNILNGLLAVGSVMLLIIGGLIYRNFKSKNDLLKKNEEIQSEKITRLEKEHQLLAMQSLIQGQEQERSRLARDLHDGLGGLLSGVKLSMSTMKGNVFLSEENARSVNHVIEQLDVSIAELRRISHNMMPEALIKYGLKEALENYSDSLNRSGKINVQFQGYGMEQRIDQNSEIIIYRIVQELLNNSLKHAEAKNVLIQLIRKENTFTLTVEDDGKGFNVDDLADKTGAGLTNIRSRAQYLNGTLDIVSKPGEGTSVTIEGKVENV